MSRILDGGDPERLPKIHPDEMTGAKPQPEIIADIFAKAFAINPAAIGITRLHDGLIIDVNESWQEMFGYSRTEALGRTVSDLWPNYSEREQFINELREKGSFRNREQTVFRKSGESFIALNSAELMVFGGEEYNLSTWLDISEQKAAVEALWRSEHLLSESQRSGHIGSWSRDIGSDQITWSDETYRIYGVPNTFTPTIRNFYNRIHPEDHAVMREFIRACTAGESPRHVEFRIFRPDGEVRTLYSRGKLQCAPDGMPLRMTGTVQDITDRKLAEEALRRSQKNLAEAQRQAHIGSFEFDFQADRLDWSEEMFRICGVQQQDFRGTTQDFINIVHPEDLQGVIKIREKGLNETGPLKLEFRIVRKSGEIRFVRMIFETHFDEAGKPLRRLGTFQDVTESKNAEEERIKLETQLQQAQKMESIGRLAGGVAHDFNNMLSVILGSVELALEDVDSKQPVYSDLKEIQKAAQRSADLTRQLLAFARKQTVAPRVLNLNDTISGTLNLLQRLIGENIELAWLPGKELWQVEIDPSQIDQILTNLCVNARDAIADVGKISISTENSIYDEQYYADYPAHAPGEYVLLSVGDDGRGMDEETLRHIFEPFFTTKERGKGTGLGLATIYGVVKQNNGFIHVNSRPGQGTTFNIFLPRHIRKDAELTAEAVTETNASGQSTVLVVEDEPAILSLTARMLEEKGYIVLAAQTPGDAIRIAEERSREIHILVTDVVMPEMNGRELAGQLQSIYPGLKCVFMSGWTADVIAHKGVLEPGTHFLRKPFAMQDLIDLLQKVQ